MLPKWSQQGLPREGRTFPESPLKCWWGYVAACLAPYPAIVMGFPPAPTPVGQNFPEDKHRSDFWCSSPLGRKDSGWGLRFSWKMKAATWGCSLGAFALVSRNLVIIYTPPPWRGLKTEVGVKKGVSKTLALMGQYKVLKWIWDSAALVLGCLSVSWDLTCWLPATSVHSWASQAGAPIRPS